MTRIKRPPSYSDSFLYINNGTSDFTIGDPVPLLQTAGPSLSSIITETEEQPIPSHYSPCEKWYNRLLGFGVHIFLLSLFETVFFFQYISQSENAGLQKTVDGYVNGILSSCGSWSQNVTMDMNEVLSLFLNVSDITEQGQQAFYNRITFNQALEIQAWMYVLGLFVAVLLSGGMGYKAGLRLAWRRILIDNGIMIVLLAFYEWTFFKTIIYRYENLSLPEINQVLINQLQNQCGLFGSVLPYPNTT
jgi:hypothetical protein